MIRPWKKRDTVENTRRLYLEYLAQALVNRRLENRARSGAAIWLPPSASYVSRSADVTSAEIVPLGDWKTALADVRGVIADAVQTPAIAGDIDRETETDRGGFPAQGTGKCAQRAGVAPRR